MAEPTHQMPIRVYYEDTDAGGIAYHTAYLRWAERGRTEYLRAAGLSHTGLRRETGCLFTVARLTITYRAPACLDDTLVVETTVTRRGRASLEMTQRVRRGSEMLALLEGRIACVDRDGRPARLPELLRHPNPPTADMLVA